MFLEDFDLDEVTYDSKRLKEAESESEFTLLAAELFKELAQYISIVSGVYKVDENYNPRLWNRNEAILGGLMVRIGKLMNGFLDSFCKNERLINEIVSRSLVESAINLLYLLRNKSDDLYNKFIKYSLRSEKQLLNKMKENIDERGHEEPIEVRMKKSIMESFDKSGVEPKEVDENNYSPWGGSIYNKFKELDLEDLYLSVMGLKSHAVHGNWQDLLYNHLEYENGKFKPKFDSHVSRPQSILPIGYLLGIITLEYTEEFLPDCDDKEILKDSIDNVVKKIEEVDELHEEFLNKNK